MDPMMPPSGNPQPQQQPPGAPVYGAPPPGAYGAPPPGAYGAPPPGAYGSPPPGYPMPGAYPSATMGAPVVANIGMGIAFGVVAAAIGAGVFGAIAVAMDSVWGIFAIVVGLFVGYAVHLGGRAPGNLTLGVIGGVCGLAGCVGGYMVAIYIVTSKAGFSLDVSDLFTEFTRITEPTTYLMLALGTYEGFRFGMGGGVNTGMRRR